MSEKKYSVPIIYEPFKETMTPPVGHGDQVYLVLMGEGPDGAQWQEVSRVRCIYSKISNREKEIKDEGDGGENKGDDLGR